MLAGPKIELRKELREMVRLEFEGRPLGVTLPTH